MIKIKNKARKSWQKSRLRTDRERLQQLGREINEKIKEFRNKKWTDLLKQPTVTDNSLWKITKRLKRTFKPIPAFEHQGEAYLDDSEKGTLLGKHYEKIFKINHSNNTDYEQTVEHGITHVINTSTDIGKKDLHKYISSPKEIKQTISRLPNNKAPGPDQLDTILYKNLPLKVLVQITYIVNAILKFQHYPQNLKKSIIVPIPKPGKNPKLMDSYRPISLINILAKIIDKIILQRILNIEGKLKLIPNEQFGFRKGHSTVAQIIRLLHYAKENFRNGMNTVVVALDMEKAFDTVWIEGLTYKMMSAGYPIYIVKLIYSYLNNRHFHVKVNNTMSGPFITEAGVPQGSSLSPHLYTIMTHDFPMSENIQTALYADDTCIFKGSFNAEIANRKIDIHLNRVVVPYLNENKLNINPQKTEQIILTRKHTNNKIKSKLKIKDDVITPNASLTYLGFHIDNRLNYHTHIKNLATKANNAIRTLYPLLNKDSCLSKENKLLLYKQTIRPILTYGYQVFCSAPDIIFVKLQRIQNKCLRLVLGKGRYSRIAALHEEANIETIQEYIVENSNKFYKTRLTSPLLRNVTEKRARNNPDTKHGLLHDKLPLFYE